MPQRSLIPFQHFTSALRPGLELRFVTRNFFLYCLFAALPTSLPAQMGGPGMGGGGAGAPPAEEKPKFREHIHNIEGLPIHREKGDAVVKNLGNPLVFTQIDICFFNTPVLFALRSLVRARQKIAADNDASKLKLRQTSRAR